MTLDIGDITVLLVLSCAVGLVLGLMLGLAIRPRHRHRRTHSLHSETSSGAPLFSKMTVEPMDVVLARNDAIGVDDAALRNRIVTAGTMVGVDHSISAGVKLDQDNGALGEQHDINAA